MLIALLVSTLCLIPQAPPDLATFYLVLLKRPSSVPAMSAEEGAAIHKAHIAHLEKLGNEGFGMAAGPFVDEGEIRGINILKANSAEHARELQGADPAVQAGRLAVEVIPFMTRRDAFSTPAMPFQPEHFFFGFLVNGPDRTQDPDTAARLQKEHLAYMAGQAEAGRLVLAGPIAAESGTRRGIVVYRASSIDEARKLAEGDPMVQARRLAVDLHPWMTAKGVLR